MKQRFSALLAGLLALCLCACGQGVAADAGPEPAAPVQASSLGCLVCFLGQGFFLVLDRAVPSRPALG